METITLKYDAWVDSVKESFQLGSDSKLEAILKALNNDAVLTMNVDAKFLGYLVEVIENA